LDSYGRIINRRQVLIDMNYRDRDGLPVNKLGYLINETTGAIYNKFTFEDLFYPIINPGGNDDGEIPMPYRLERHNFNPHAVFGNFEFDKATGKPIFLKNKHGQLTDINFRPVNQSGFLINEREDIIDNDGSVKFIQEMLNDKGDIPNLYNYAGRAYKINEIMGQLRKNSQSKEIIVNLDK
jgi:hypothetical protein